MLPLIESAAGPAKRGVRRLVCVGQGRGCDRGRAAFDPPNHWSMQDFYNSLRVTVLGLIGGTALRGHQTGTIAGVLTTVFSNSTWIP